MAGATTDATAQQTKQTLLSRVYAMLRWLDLQAPRLLAIGITLWIMSIFVASVYKYETYGQGYDQVDFEQAIWNTVQGRPMEDSRFNFTGSVFGMDWMPMLFLFVPFYAVLPSAHTLFFLQIVGAAAGAVPVYWLARDKMGSKVAGLGFGVAYLLYPVLLHGVLNPFQVRLFSVTLLLFAFYWYEKGNWKLFWLCAVIAMLARSDVSFVIIMFGVYGLLTRKSWPQVVAPMVVGAGYFVLSALVLVPAFAYPGALDSPAGPIIDPMQCWPCGINPQLAYYGHLGSNGPEIIWNVISRPVDTFQLVFTSEKIGYIVSLLLPVLFLPLLSIRPLVLGLPILALNLLSTRSAQFDYQHHYSLLLIPGIFAAAVYGAANLVRWDERRSTKDEGRRQASEITNNELQITGEGAGSGGRTLIVSSLLVLGLVVWGLVIQVPFKNPAVRAFLFPEPPATVAAANKLAGMVPLEAKVAVSSKLAPHLLPRRHIYNFPPAPYSPYNFDGRVRDDYVNLDYILVDPDAAALPFEGNLLDQRTGLEVLESLPEWKLVAEEEELRLYRRE